MLFFHSGAQENIGYEFKNSQLLRQCFTHASYANEHRGEKDNERLEFLGDSVLGLIITEYLFKNKREDEGGMTSDKQKIVSTKPLANAIRKLGIEDYLLVSGENSSILTDKVCENLFESIVGGIYLDGGYDEAKKFVYKTLIPEFEKIIKNKKDGDYKTQLNELVSKRKLGVLRYVTVDKKGSDHNPNFIMAVLINGNEIAQGEGGSKKSAEQLAAKKTLQILKSGKIKDVKLSKN